MSIFYAVIYILLICGAVALGYWAIDKLGTPEPLNRIIKVLGMVVAIVLVVIVFLNLLGMGVGGGLPPLK